MHEKVGWTVSLMESSMVVCLECSWVWSMAAPKAVLKADGLVAWTVEAKAPCSVEMSALLMAGLWDKGWAAPMAVKKVLEMVEKKDV